MSDNPTPRRNRPPAPPAPAAESAEVQSSAAAGRSRQAPPPPPTQGYPKPESLAGKGMPPVWVWPSIALGLIYPVMARSARLDAALIERLPDPPTNLRRLPSAYQTLLVGFVVVVAVVFGLFRGGGAFEELRSLGFGYDVVFTESYPFMLLALIIGMLSPSAGLLLVLLFMPLDLVSSMLASSGFGYGQMEPFLPALAGRAVSWWLLWLLACGIPLMARSIPGTTLASGQPRDPTLRLALAYAGAGVTAGVLLWMWTAALPFLVRPVFSWTSLGSPTDPAVQPIQSTGHVIIAAGIVLVLAITAVRHRFGVLDEEVHEIDAPSGDVGEIDTEDEPIFSDQLETVGKIAVQAFAVIALGGIITGAIDVAVLFSAAVIGQLAAARLTRVQALATTLWRIPWVIRFVAAFVVTLFIGFAVNAIIFEPLPAANSEFFPLVVTTALGLALFRVLLGVVEPPGEDEAEESPEKPAAAAGAAAGVLLVLVLGGIVFLATPAPVAAGNCSGWGDCPVTMEAVAAAGAGSAAVVALTAALAASRAEEPREREKRKRRRRRAGRAQAPAEAASGEPAAQGNVVDRLRDKALKNYYGRR